MTNLSSQKCIPCEVGGPPLSPEEAKIMLEKNIPTWQVADDAKKITKTFKFKDFKESMNFVNKIADIAEGEGHHPDIYIYYNKVKIDLTTHAVKGLSNNDFIVASKIDLI
jgi:4a-hydroxytetrahydrobiopterin dehydratase